MRFSILINLQEKERFAKLCTYLLDRLLGFVGFVKEAAQELLKLEVKRLWSHFT